MKAIVFTKPAKTAFSSLSQREQNNAMTLLEIAASDYKNPILQTKIYKLSAGLSSKHLYAIKISSKLRMVIDIDDEQIIVLDILNHDLFIKYFKHF